MNICIFGSGAIGSYIGSLLIKSGINVSLICRGEHLNAIQSNGLLMQSAESEKEYFCKPLATDNPHDLEKQDFIIVTLKAHSAALTANMLTPLLKNNTTVVSAVNGLPWWYFYKSNNQYENMRLQSVDPKSLQWDYITPKRSLGCVVYPAAEIKAPGHVFHIEGDRFPIGEPDGSISDRAKTLSKVLIQAGLKSPVRKKIRDDIWMKLWGNLAFNPISALTGDTLENIANNKESCAIVRKMMLEGQAVAEALGVNFPISLEKRIDGTRNVGAHKTSTLQDLELGRPMEIDALTKSVSEAGKIVNIPTPTIDIIYEQVKAKAIKAGCYIDPNL
jgi:2-dehydropantoate 2-reductase|tara:strand:+ start:1352 stop:2347 length:996 start_codon:yes stop_codon:yes gene_type:complete